VCRAGEEGEKTVKTVKKRPIGACALAVCVALAAGADVSAQDSGGWTVPRLPWGDPDLRGKWPLEMGRTPMQRPEKLGTRAYLTDEEYAAAFERAENSAKTYDRENQANRIGQGHWSEFGTPLHQTSLIVEPANGRMPAMTEEGRRRAANMKSSWSEQVFDDLSDFNSLDRCITRGLPASMIPFPYNNGVEIYQAPGYVVIRLELIHETRVIPVDGRAAPPKQIVQWLGGPRGHWEGDTLVIETANFNGDSPMVIVGPSNEPVPTSTSLKITERLTRTGPGTIEYEAFVEDPVVLTAPFRMKFPWTRNDDYRIFEYACHEDNSVVPNYIHATSPRFAASRNARDEKAEEQERGKPDR
jgi:hypothetical protein